MARFLADHALDKVYLLTGGACALMVDAIARQTGVAYFCFHHEQAAAMAADAVWRTTGRMGVAMATSGPGATNLCTGIACSYFDSIPALFITGQANLAEGARYEGFGIRQAGFQETKIVEMVRPITKYAVQVRSGAELRRELPKAYRLALEGRMGPVLIDIPMEVQQEEMGPDVERVPPPQMGAATGLKEALADFLRESRRPLVLLGGGVGLAGVEREVADWLSAAGLPFVATWAGLGYANHAAGTYCGAIGVYGNRGANYLIQNCSDLLVLGARLDNRQRSGDPRRFAPEARVRVVDIDAEELRKHAADRYATVHADLRRLPALLPQLPAAEADPAWLSYANDIRGRFLRREHSGFADARGSLSPYAVLRRISADIADDAIVVGDTGAALCWLMQSFERRAHTLFTAAGNSPMGYALPAAIGAALQGTGRQVVCVAGDGGFHLNIHELQTAAHYGLDLVCVVMNNGGYGIIKQFQNSNTGGRHHATGDGYSSPDFAGVATAYGFEYVRVETLDDIPAGLSDRKGRLLLDIILDPDTEIEPKAERGRPINDQYPLVDDRAFAEANRFVTFARS